MSSMARFHALVFLTLVCLLAASSPVVSGQEMEEESYRAWAVNMSNVHPGGTTSLQNPCHPVEHG